MYFLDIYRHFTLAPPLFSVCCSFSVKSLKIHLIICKLIIIVIIDKMTIIDTFPIDGMIAETTYVYTDYC